MTRNRRTKDPFRSGTPHASASALVNPADCVLKLKFSAGYLHLDSGDPALLSPVHSVRCISAWCPSKGGRRPLDVSGRTECGERLQDLLWRLWGSKNEQHSVIREAGESVHKPSESNEKALIIYQSSRSSKVSYLSNHQPKTRKIHNSHFTFILSHIWQTKASISHLMKLFADISHVSKSGT